jgi:SAM-dependent methyltransferase
MGKGSWQNRLYLRLQKTDEERKQILSFFKKMGLPTDHRILDVGCGFGRSLELLTSEGYQIEGVEVNHTIVEDVRSRGYSCYTPEELSSKANSYDALLFSHIIEHFSPSDLLKFMEIYLDLLKPEGFIVVATPLEGPMFFDDFDHIRPYHPTGFNMVFGSAPAQVQYQGRNRLKLEDIWFRRTPFRQKYARSLYIQGGSRLPILNNLLLGLLFHVSFGLIGRTTAWVGLYRKIV